MKKFLKLFFGRMLWIGLIILLQVSLILFLVIFFDEVLISFFSLFGYVISQENSWIFQGYTLLVNTVFTTLFGFIVAMVVLNSNANSAYKITWLIFIGAIPVVGSCLYLMLGNKNTAKKTAKKIAPIRNAMKHIPTSNRVVKELENNEEGYRALLMSNYITKVSGSGIYDHTKTTYYPLGDDAWPAMLEELKKAKHYIFMEYFIIERGMMWDAIHEILVQKVLEGVDVRLMYDDVGCVGTLPWNYYKILNKEGIKCIAYNRMKPVVNVKLNNRDHRKILVIDGHTGFTGGINIADEYINTKIKFGHWKDNAIMLKGNGVHGLTMLFLSNWVGHSGNLSELSDEKYHPHYYLKEDGIAIQESDGYVQPYGDLPYDDEPVGERVYLNLIHHAKKYVYITTPYLIIDEEMRDSLCTAVKEGKQVVILTPHIPDKKMIFNVTRSYYRPLLEAGVRIFEYTPGFIHEKVFISDDQFATIGTVNLDYRSLYLHMECGTFLYKTSTVMDMKNDFIDTLNKSQEITLEKYKKIRKGKGLLWAFLRLFAPLM